MSRRGRIGSVLLLTTVVGTGGALAAWKYASKQEARAASANQPEPIESVTVAVAKALEHRQTTTSIGTVIALRSITLRNELPGTVRQVMLTPGQVVDAGTVLVALDISVEEADLKAQEAQAALAETTLDRMQRAHGEGQPVSAPLALHPEHGFLQEKIFQIQCRDLAHAHARGEEQIH